MKPLGCRAGVRWGHPAVLSALAVGALLSGCKALPRWQDDLRPALVSARRAQRDLVIYFALPGRDASDAMQATLDDPVVVDALRAGVFDAVVVDGIERKRLYSEWIGGGEGMGIAVLDAAGEVYAARPGPQDPPQIAAMLRKCAATRDELLARRQEHQESPHDPVRSHALGSLYLDLGCRVRCEALLVDAAMLGVADARHRLARLYALDGNLGQARRWLETAPKTPVALATEGYVLFKERRHQEAVEAFRAALDKGAADSGGLAAGKPAAGELAADKLAACERQRALLYLGKSLHESRDDDEAVPLLEKLAAEGTGSTFEAAARHTLNHIYAGAGEGAGHRH
ncbi:MAG: hypothetical protein AB8H80_15065 [Planctomycetota bacterium]